MGDQQHSLKIVLVLVTFWFFMVLPLPSNDTGYRSSEQTTSNRTKRSYETRHKPMEGQTKVTQQKETAKEITGGSGKPGVFATENCTVVVAQIGGTATLPCVVRKFNNGVVSWIRKNDLHLLTVGLTTYNADDRFMVEHVRHLQNWGLLIKHVQPSDAGLYECQVSTHPPTSIFLELKVTEAIAEIQGAPDLHLRAGSLLRLVCTLKQSTEPPAYYFWYHEQRMINYDPGVQVLPDTSSSVLLISEADKSHNGNYTCKPSNTVPASINVHVLNATVEEKPAAMQHANGSYKVDIATSAMLTILVLLFSVYPNT
nr:lachesin-like [Onthophagus taurus]XP_022913916.1 lachesin-like [Onthophagus taurus]